MSVVFDRITGLAGLVLLAAAAGLFATETGIAQDIGRWSGWIAVVTVCTTVFALFALDRGWLRIPSSIDRIGTRPSRPGFWTRLAPTGAIPGAVVSATAISVVVQVLLASAAGCCGWAIGVGHELPAILVAMPIILHRRRDPDHLAGWPA